MSSVVWGVPVENLYKYVLQYYRREKEQLRLDYNKRVELLALFKQIKLGPYSSDKDTETGYFDMIGADRRKAWIALGSQSKVEAQMKVVQLLESVCPSLKGAVLKCMEETSHTHPENRNGVCSGDQPEVLVKEEEQKMVEVIQFHKDNSDNLASTTSKANSLASPPNGLSSQRPMHNPSRQSQASSFPQSQISGSPQPQRTQISGSSQPQATQVSGSPQHQRPQASGSPQLHRPQASASTQSQHSHTQPCYSPLAPAALWCSPKSAHQFVAQMRSSQASSLKLSPGERLSVQVPTSPQASAVVWEFATEQGDIGFGLYFQRGGVAVAEQLLPATPRDCSVDLIIGKHQYQEQGTYLLEFINTHSSRPKTVFYRVFYHNSTIQQ